MSRDSIREQRERAADGSPFDAEDFAVEQRRDRTEVAPTRDAQERVAREQVDELAGELPREDDIFLPEEASPVVAGAEVAQETIVGQEELQAATEGRVDLTSPTEVIEALPTDDDVDLEIRDGVTRTIRADDVEAAQEALEERREAFEADPVEFVEEIEADTFEQATALDRTARQARRRRRAVREARDELRDEAADDLEAFEPEDIDVSTDFQAGRVEFEGIDDAALRAEAERATDEVREEIADEFDGVEADDVAVEVDPETGRLDGLGDFLREETGAPLRRRRPLEQRAEEGLARLEAREEIADEFDVVPADVDIEADGDDLTARVERPDVEEFDGQLGGLDAARRVEDVRDQRQDFRAEAADEFGVAVDDVEVEFDDGEFRARPDTRGSIDTSAGVTAIPFAGSGFGFDDLPEPGDRLGFDDFREPIEREFDELAEAVDPATIVPPLDQTPGAEIADRVREFDVEDIPGAGARIGADDIREFDVEDIPGAGAQFGEEDVEAAAVEAVEAFEDTPGGRAAGAAREFDVEDIPGAGAQFDADDIEAAASEAVPAVEVEDIPGAGERIGFEDLPRPGDRAAREIGTAEAAFAAGAAGIAVPEPGTTVAGAGLATVAAGALVVDGVRRSEIDTPEQGDLIGGGAGVGTEIEAPETPEADRPEIVTPVEADVQPAELGVDEASVDVTEIPVDEAGATVTEIDTPTVEADAIVDQPGSIEQPGDFITPEGPTIDDPLDEDTGAPAGAFVDREGVRFPAEEAFEPTVDESFEDDAVEFEPTEFDTVTGPAVTSQPREVTAAEAESFVDVEAGTFDAVEPEFDAGPDTTPAFGPTSATEPATALDTGVEAGLPTATSTAEATPEEFAQPTEEAAEFGQPTLSASGPQRPVESPRLPRPEFEADPDTGGIDDEFLFAEETFEVELEDPDFLGGDFDVAPDDFDI